MKGRPESARRRARTCRNEGACAEGSNSLVVACPVSICLVSANGEAETLLQVAGCVARDVAECAHTGSRKL